VVNEIVINKKKTFSVAIDGTFIEIVILVIKSWKIQWDRLCGLMVRVPDYRSRGPGSIPIATRFSEKYCVWNGVHSAS
jgi:hypothetical protein